VRHVGAAVDPDKVAFNTPPVRRVELTVYFKPIQGFQVSHLSSLREQWRVDYPNSAELPPVRPVNRGGEETKLLPIGSAWPLPYIVWSTEDEERAVGIQNDRFAISWGFSEKSEQYPGFAALSAELERRLAELETVVKRETGVNLEILGSECGYLNELPEMPVGELLVGVATKWVVDGSAAPAIPATYSGIRMHLCNDPALKNCVLDMALDLDDDGPFLSITSAFDLPEDAEGETLPLGGLRHAHDRLIETFLDFTSADMHEKWGRRA
jgi:hypothetical protein